MNIREVDTDESDDEEDDTCYDRTLTVCTLLAMLLVLGAAVYFLVTHN